ncbi:MAG: DUF1499 domain-containing protein [Gammaproteobacteria bacterium]
MARKTSALGKMALAWAWLALVVGIVAVALLAVAGPLYRHGSITLGAAFDLLHKGFWVGIVAAAAGVVGVIATLIARRYGAAVITLLALVLGVVAFGWPWMLLHEARAAPPIHDITTNPAAPPQFIALAAQRKSAPNGLDYAGSAGNMGKHELGALTQFFAGPAGRASPGHDAAVKACASWGSACLAAVQQAYYPDIRPLLTPDTAPDKAYAAALAAAKAMGWKIAVADAASRHIEATATTSWFGFQDDVAIDVSPSGSGSVVNIRSESRLGLSDVGMNAKRVRAYLHRLQEQLPGAHM